MTHCTHCIHEGLKDTYQTPTSSGYDHRQAQGENKNWPPHPCLLGGPKEGGNATSPFHSQGSPRPSAGSKIRSGRQQRGTKSEVAASPLPSRGRKRGRKCEVSPAFSGVPNANRGEQNHKWRPHPCLPEKAGVRRPILMLFPLVGDHQEYRGGVSFPPSFGPPKGHG